MPDSLAPPAERPLQLQPDEAEFEVSGHLGSHRNLVPWARTRFIPGRVAPTIDVVAIPASRPAAGLHEAASVARLIGAQLVILASRQTVPAEAQQVAERYLPRDRVVVVTQRGKWHVPKVVMTADIQPMSRGRTSDTSAKRNLALALARMCGWERLLFLDDDVSGFRAPELEAVRRALADGTDLEAVGWTFDRFPDNSMVCHAYRLAGGRQSTFLGGGTLAVRVGAHTPHFPLVYNEDWLFMLPMMLRRRRSLARAGSLSQARFDPFHLPSDATKQEFGDVLAEGLLRTLHLGMDISLAQTRGYWRTVLQIRKDLIEQTAAELRRVRARGRSAPHLDAAVRALEEARRLHDQPVVGDGGATMPWTDALARWVVAWRHDSLAWSNYISSLEPVHDVDTALRRLRLTRFLPDAASSPTGSAPQRVRV